MVESFARAERIWQSSTDLINPQTRNGAEQLLEWIKWVVDVMPESDGPENFEDFEKTVWLSSTIEVCGWVVRIRSDQISFFLVSTGRDE